MRLNRSIIRYGTCSKAEACNSVGCVPEIRFSVACGSRTVACELAKHAAHVTGHDLTPTMIAEAEKRQQEQSLPNVSWQIGDVLPLPFPSDHFSCVVTRYSFHHFLDPIAVLLEMVRVCKPNGRVMVVDAVHPSEKIDAYNRMKQLRDLSHTKALSVAEMARAIETSGLSHIRTGRYKVEMEWERQLAASFLPSPWGQRQGSPDVSV